MFYQLVWFIIFNWIKCLFFIMFILLMGKLIWWRFIKFLATKLRVSFNSFETLYLCEKYSWLFVSSISNTANKVFLSKFDWLIMASNLFNLSKYLNSAKISKKISFNCLLLFNLTKFFVRKILNWISWYRQR